MEQNDKPDAVAIADAVTLPIPAPVEPFDAEAMGQAYLESAIARTRSEYFKRRTPLAYQDEFDPSHPKLAKFPNAEAIARVLAWRKSETGLLLSGPQGRGKTRAAFALCRRLLCDESVNVAIWHASEWFSELQTFVHYGNDEAAGFVERSAARPVFFLDDFGQQALLRSREDWAQAWFFRFLDLRLGAKLPLILTTNQTADQIAGRDFDIKGDPLLRRLLDLAEPIKFL